MKPSSASVLMPHCEVDAPSRWKIGRMPSLYVWTMLTSFQFEPVTFSLFRIVFQMVLNHSDVEEILQETFYRFFLALKRVKDTDPYPFLKQIAVRRSYTFLKSRKNEVSFDEIPEQSAELVVQGKSLGIREIYDFAYTLPPKRRIVFILREIMGMEDGEIARELGISETTVRRHAQMARDEFKGRFML